MNITKEIEMLEISSSIMGRTSTIYPVIFHDDDNVILVDTGFPNQLELFKEAFISSGIPFDKLNKIILTHQDVDHIGNLAAFISNSNKSLDILCHEIEKSYIDGEKQAVKLTQMEANLDKLPEDRKAFLHVLKSFFDKLKPCITATVTDGEVLPACNGITVIHTPGHTPGHICLYHNDSKTLIAGDTFTIENGSLKLSAPQINYNKEDYIASIKKLSGYNILRTVCYHGGIYEGNVSQELLQLVENRK